MSSFSPGVFGFTDTPTAEIDRLESFYGPLAESVRRLVDVTIRTDVDEETIRRATAEIEAITAQLEKQVAEGPAGVHFNTDGRSWQWGNAAVGLRNAVAPPMEVRVEDGVARAEVVLGAAYEGPPGMVHGGISALLLDHLMGVTASTTNPERRRPTMTGTLTLRYRRPTPLGRVRLEGWIEREEDVKTFVRATIGDEEGTTIEAEGVWIVPRWARERFAPRDPAA